MCGVAGIFAYHYAAAPVDRAELRVIRDAMEKRGPDGFGEWFSDDGRIGLGHRRLAIIDLDERANQPMVSTDGKYVISYNGEIYNYRELRTQLEKKGYRFRTESDTEVLLQMFVEHGTNMLTQLRGMFAFILLDVEKNKMLLARDTYGIKPLYYANDGWTFYAASQVKALLKLRKISRDPEPAGIVGFFLMGSVPEPFTLYQEIRQIPAGHFMWVDSTGPHETECYESIAEIFTKAVPCTLGEDEQNAFVRETLTESLRYHFVSDVPVGIFLSAGVDSNVIATLGAALATEQITAVTLTFDEFLGTSNDEGPLAIETAQRLGLKHKVYRLTRREFEADLSNFFESMDQPSIDGLNTYFVSKAAKSFGLKTVLSGVGGDEMFGGYPSFKRVPHWSRMLWLLSRIPGAGQLWQALYDCALSRKHNTPKLAGVIQYGGSEAGAYLLTRGIFIPDELKKFLDHGLAKRGLERLNLLQGLNKSFAGAPHNAGARVSILESSWYLRNQLLRDSDWTSMAHSLEVRTPFVDREVLSRLSGVLIKNKTWDKERLKDAFDQQLAKGIKERCKTGFTLPMREWLTDMQPASIEHQPWARLWARQVYQRVAA